MEDRGKGGRGANRDKVTFEQQGRIFQASLSRQILFPHKTIDFSLSQGSCRNYLEESTITKEATPPKFPANTQIHKMLKVEHLETEK